MTNSCLTQYHVWPEMGCHEPPRAHTLGKWRRGVLDIFLNRSEGEAERDIGSPCMIGLGLVVVEKFFRRRRRRRRPPGGGTPENLKIQVTKVSRYEVFGESGWRGSIRLVELVSNFKLSYLKTLPGTQHRPNKKEY